MTASSQTPQKKVTRTEVLKIAQIASIEIQEHEIDPLVHELQAVLNYVSVLQDVIEAHETHEKVNLFKAVNVMREDIPHDYDAKTLVKAAPEHEEHYFVVPAIIKQ